MIAEAVDSKNIRARICYIKSRGTPQRHIYMNALILSHSIMRAALSALSMILLLVSIVSATSTLDGGYVIRLRVNNASSSAFCNVYTGSVLLPRELII